MVEELPWQKKHYQHVKKQQNIFLKINDLMFFNGQKWQ